MVTVTLKNNFGLARAQVLDHFARTIMATARDIEQATKQNMTPGHFLLSSLSQQTTTSRRTGPYSAIIQVPTQYAWFPEKGTKRMAPRPVLTPACMLCFPSRLYQHWDEAILPDAGPILGRMGPLSIDPAAYRAAARGARGGA